MSNSYKPHKRNRKAEQERRKQRRRAVGPRPSVKGKHASTSHESLTLSERSTYFHSLPREERRKALREGLDAYRAESGRHVSPQKARYTMSGRVVEDKVKSARDKGPIARFFSNRIVMGICAILFIFVIYIGIDDATDNPAFAEVFNLNLGSTSQNVITFDHFNEAESEEQTSSNSSSNKNTTTSADASSEQSTSSENTSSSNTTTESTSDQSDAEYVNLRHETKWDHYRHTAKEALAYYGLSDAWTNTILAMIKVESNGNANIDSQSDIMQTKEGDGRSILYNGVLKQGVVAGTPEASIYAGVFEFEHCITDFVNTFGRDPSPTDENDIALLTQGYNYGHQGWFNYCKKNGYTTWSLSMSKAYQNKIGGLGTANHGGKCKAAYEDFVAQYGEGK